MVERKAMSVKVICKGGRDVYGTGWEATSKRIVLHVPLTIKAIEIDNLELRILLG
jgi:hypothetical protein